MDKQTNSFIKQHYFYEIIPDQRADRWTNKQTISIKQHYHYKTIPKQRTDRQKDIILLYSSSTSKNLYLNSGQTDKETYYFYEASKLL